MKKRAQVQQIFIYVIAIILFSLMLAYGYNAISDFKARTDNVALLQLKNDISSGVKRTATDYGTIKKEELDVPIEYKKICFVDLTANIAQDNTAICDDTNNANNYEAIVCDSWTSKSDYNMFLISQKDTITYNIGEIKINNPFFFCINVTGGKAILKMEGKGDHVLLSKW